MNQRIGLIASRPHARHRRFQRTRKAGYWEYAPWVAILMLSLIGIRVHEVIPEVARIRPVLLAIVFGAGTLLLMSGVSAHRSALNYLVTKIVAAYFFWIAFTVPLGIWPGGSFTVWMGLIGPIVMYYTVVLCAPTLDNLAKIQWGIVVATALYLLINLIVGSPRVGAWRLYSAGSHDPNDLAALFSVVLPLAAGLVARSRVPLRIVAIAICMILVLGLLRTGSRGGVLASMVGVLVFTLAYRGIRLFTVLSIVTLAGVMAWHLASQEFRGRMLTLTDLGEDYNIQGEMGRMEVWRRGVSYFFERPVFGFGAGNFQQREGRRLLDEGRSGKWSTTHNAYLQAAVDLGLVGGLLFVALMASTARRAKRMWRAKIARRAPDPGALMRPEMLASASAAATAAVFLSMAYSWIIFMMVALVALADRVNIAESARRSLNVR